VLNQGSPLKESDLGHLGADVHADHVAPDGLAPTLPTATPSLGPGRTSPGDLPGDGPAVGAAFSPYGTGGRSGGRTLALATATRGSLGSTSGPRSRPLCAAAPSRGREPLRARGLAQGTSRTRVPDLGP